MSDVLVCCLASCPETGYFTKTGPYCFFSKDGQQDLAILLPHFLPAQGLRVPGPLPGLCLTVTNLTQLLIIGGQALY